MRKGLLFLIVLGAAMMTAVNVSGQKQLKKLINAQFAISQFYVDSVNDDRLVEDAIKGMLNKLDPHSTYSNATETKELEEPLQGNFSGIGIQFNMKEDTLYVIQTIVGGPSERVGILAGDRIVEVNDTAIAGVKMKNSDIMKRLRGPKGTEVRVKVKRHNVPELIDFRIVRDNIPLFSIDASYMVDNITGYVRISRFAEKTHSEFMDAVKSLKKQGMKQIIVDLCDNGGGYLQIATELANEFLAPGQTIVYTEGRNSPRYDATAKGGGALRDVKAVFLVNQYSASASEILSGAIQDWDRGVIVGRRTFGKGLVQRPFRFEDGSMIRLTIARYYTPSGRCIQKPYEAGNKKSYDEDIYNRYKDGELAHADSIHFADSLRYTTLNTHRTIYGGGGIMPDEFVPLDTVEYTKYYRDLMAKGIFNRYVISYVDSHRKDILKQWKKVADFDKSFTVTDEMLSDLCRLGVSDSVKINEEELAKSRELIRSVTKALLARDVYTDPAAYYMVINHRNPIFLRGLEIINDDKLYRSKLQAPNTEE